MRSINTTVYWYTASYLICLVTHHKNLSLFLFLSITPNPDYLHGSDIQQFSAVWRYTTKSSTLDIKPIFLVTPAVSSKFVIMHSSRAILKVQGKLGEQEEINLDHCIVYSRSWASLATAKVYYVSVVLITVYFAIYARSLVN